MKHFDFIGSWQMIPERCIYEDSVPPKSSILKISIVHLEPLQLQFEQSWFTHDNISYETQFIAIADGSANPFEHTEIADSIAITVTDKSTFEVVTFKHNSKLYQQNFTVNARGHLEIQHEYFNADTTHKRFDIFHKQLSVLPYASSVSGVAVVPSSEGVIKHKALQAMVEQTDMHLNQIKQQIELLAKQAHDIQRRKELSLRIYQSRMSFVPQIGQTYHLYEKRNGEYLLSLVGPTEWGSAMPFKAFSASVKLLADHTWTEI